MLSRLADAIDRLPAALFAAVLILATFAGVLLACGLFWAICLTARGAMG